MTHPTNYAYHSTGQFRNVVKSIQQQSKFNGFDENGEVIINELAVAPTLEYIGTVKLHGTNASIVLQEDGTISFHSKNNLLGYVKNGSFTLLSDNAAFAQEMFQRFDSVLEVIESAKRVVKGVTGVDLFPIKISGEWCGQGIQRGVGISYLPKRSLFIFGIKAGDTKAEVKQGWLPVEMTSQLTSTDTHIDRIYAITDFPFKKVKIDFNEALSSQNYLVECTLEVEDTCPVSKELELVSPDGTPQLLGEGLVWTPASEDYCWDSDNWFKTKGEKHSVSKVKSVAAVDTNKLSSIKEFVEYSVTENRLHQGILEVGKDQKLIGAFIGWISKDICKEESDTLADNNLSMKDVGSSIANKARYWYISQL